MNSLAQAVRKTRELIASMPAGEARDLAERTFDRFGAALRELPGRVGERAPFATAAEARQVLTEECQRVVHMLDALDG
jgi:hypothetical protein